MKITNICLPLTIVAIAAIGLTAVISESKLKTPDCYKTEDFGTVSKVRLNTCTGEGHIIMRGKSGRYEWVRIDG